MVKPRLGIAGGVLFKANSQGVPIITQPRKERKIREHNTDMMETRAARVEQNTRHKAEPSTLYQVLAKKPCVATGKKITRVLNPITMTQDLNRLASFSFTWHHICISSILTHSLEKKPMHCNGKENNTHS